MAKLAPTTEKFETGRLRREWRTMQAMVEIYCRALHATAASRSLSSEQTLCPECRDFLNYAAVRLDRCQFGTEKPTCAKCPVHCYQRQRRDQVREIMRYAGPRMVLRHPVLSIFHWLDARREAPPLRRG